MNIERHAIEEKIMEIIKGDETILEDVGERTDIFEVNIEEIGLSSISYVKLLVLIENEFEIEIPDDYLQVYEFRTIESIVDYIMSVG